MTVEQLKEVMKYHLESFNDEGVEISDDTVHKDVLAESDGRCCTEQVGER